MMIQVDDVHVFAMANDANEDSKIYEFSRTLSNNTLWAIAKNQMKAETLLEEYAKESGLDIEEFFLASSAKICDYIARDRSMPRRKTVLERIRVLKAG